MPIGVATNICHLNFGRRTFYIYILYVYLGSVENVTYFGMSHTLAYALHIAYVVKRFKGRKLNSILRP